MFNKSKYGNILKILLVIVILSLSGIALVIGYKMYNSYYIVAGAKAAAEQFEETVKNNTQSSNTTTYKEFTVIGTIRIPSIDFKYPVLQENTTEALKTSVVLMYTSQGLNKSGNTVITGHNYRNGTMFSDLNKLKENDYIYILNSTGEEIPYKIYNIYETDKNDNNHITRNTEGKKEITLSTITDDSKSKIVILAEEKQ